MNDFFKLILSMSISGSVVALLLIAVRPFVKERLSKAWQYYIWLVVILRLLIPYSPEVSLVGNLFDGAEAVSAGKVTNQAAAAPAAEIIGGTAGQSHVNKPYGQTLPEQLNESSYDYSEYIWAIWVLGMLAFLAVRTFQYGRFTYCIRAGSYIVKDREMTELFKQVMNELGIKRKLLLCQSKLVKSPMLIGLLKPVIVIGENSLAAENLSYVFKHELIHYKRLDIWYKWLVQLTACIHWFNPLVHIMSRRINSMCEFSCDEAVAKGLDATGKMEYCSTIISVASFNNTYRGNLASVTLCDEKKNLKERLRAILRGGKKSAGSVALSAVLIAALCFAAIFLGAFSMGNYGKEPINATEVPAYSPGGTEAIDSPGYIGKKVIIDPGHGGTDTGAVYSYDNGTEIKEKELNLKIALMLQDMLKESGVNVELTRQADNRSALEDRMKLANDSNASLLVSIHFNVSQDRTKQGTLTMYNSSEDNSIYGITAQKTAQAIHDEIVSKLGTEDAGVMAMSKSLKYDSLKMPAVIIELAFMSNESDRKRLMSEEFNYEAAKALHEGIISVLNNTKAGTQ